MATFYVGKKFVDRPFSYILISQNTKNLKALQEKIERTLKP